MRIEIHPVAEINQNGSVRIIVWKREFKMATVANKERCLVCDGLGYDVGTGNMCQECAGVGEIFNGTKEVERLVSKSALSKCYPPKDLQWVEVAEGASAPIEAFHQGHVIDEHGCLVAGDWQ